MTVKDQMLGKTVWFAIDGRIASGRCISISCNSYIIESGRQSFDVPKTFVFDSKIGALEKIMELHELKFKVKSKYVQLQYAPDAAKIKMLRNIRYMERKIEEKETNRLQPSGKDD